jgi:hypothetical protein
MRIVGEKWMRGLSMRIARSQKQRMVRETGSQREGSDKQNQLGEAQTENGQTDRLPEKRIS